MVNHDDHFSELILVEAGCKEGIKYPTLQCAPFFFSDKAIDKFRNFFYFE